VSRLNAALGLIRGQPGEKFGAQVKDLLTGFVVLLAAFAAGGVLLAFFKVNPFRAYVLLFTGAFGTLNNFAETLVQTSPLLLTGLGVAICFQCGVWNVGAEGQLYIGAIAAVGLGMNVWGLPGFTLLPVCILGSFLAGGLWGLLPGWLKVRFGANEVIVTIMLNYIAIILSTYLIAGPWASGLTPVTKSIDAAARLPILIPGTRLHSGFLIGLIMAVLLYFLMYRTVFGYQIRAVGNNPNAAKYAGIRVGSRMMLTLGIGGGVAALAGLGEVAGIHWNMPEQISPGYGFTGIVVALLGGLHPLWIILSSLFFSALFVGAESMQRVVGIPVSLVWVLQGLIVIFILASRLLGKYASTS
jgi:simple sugar transport system permease protein